MFFMKKQKLRIKTFLKELEWVLLTYITFSSGGTFSEFSHEFQTVTEAGEDVIYVDESKKIAINKEVYNDEVIENLGLQKKSL